MTTAIAQAQDDDAELVAWLRKVAPRWKDDQSNGFALFNMESLCLRELNAKINEAADRIEALARLSVTTPDTTVLVEAQIREAVKEGDGCWRSCSGCYETSDGQNVHGYPFSNTFDCVLGSGCQECGGLGAMWDSTDYEDWARWMLEQEQRARLASTANPTGEAE